MAFLLGDSHANALGASLHRLMQARGEKVLDLTHDGCLYAVSIRRDDDDLDCLSVNRMRRDILLGSSVQDVIVLMRATPHIERSVYVTSDGIQERADRNVTDPLNLPGYRRLDGGEVLDAASAAEALKRDLLALQAGGKRLIVVKPLPEMGRHPYRQYVAAYRRGLEAEPVSEPLARYRARHQRWLAVLQDTDALTTVPLQDIFCDTERCYSMRAGRWLFEDDDHPSIHAADMIVARLLDALDDKDDGGRR